MGEMIYLCQPDELKGCSVCCGLFNHKDVSKKSLTRFLDEGLKRELRLHSHENYCEPEEVRERDTHICPYQGFLAPGKPGCLLHPEFCGVEKRERSLFSFKICSGFLCPAHYILSSEEKLALIMHIDDWYLYSVAVIDPCFFSEVYRRALDLYGGKVDQIKKFLNNCLNDYALEIENCDKSFFSYSVSEYYMKKTGVENSG